MSGPPPERLPPLPLKGAEVRGSKPTCVGLDGPRKGRVSRPCGLQGTPAAWRSQIRGVRLDGASASRGGSGATASSERTLSLSR